MSGFRKGLIIGIAVMMFLSFGAFAIKTVTSDAAAMFELSRSLQSKNLRMDYCEITEANKIVTNIQGIQTNPINVKANLNYYDANNRLVVVPFLLMVSDQNHLKSDVAAECERVFALASRIVREPIKIQYTPTTDIYDLNRRAWRNRITNPIGGTT